ncbi:hypothetical protein [Halobacterium zhouii]|uniref:hypothetical protein n=1 Tax=Halobacterium zhouii TaxID=2902624 RepID=UPI001E351064|nr:hypothetical protein [Halobacterium zhouii]
MDEVLEAAEMAQDAGLEGAFVWLFRIIGLLAVLAGLALWLFANWSLLWIPAALIVAGVLLLAIPQLLLELLELAG